VKNRLTCPADETRELSATIPLSKLQNVVDVDQASKCLKCEPTQKWMGKAAVVGSRGTTQHRQDLFPLRLRRFCSKMPFRPWLKLHVELLQKLDFFPSSAGESAYFVQSTTLSASPRRSACAPGIDATCLDGNFYIIVNHSRLSLRNCEREAYQDRTGEGLQEGEGHFADHCCGLC
jgi:hypothetical protein